MFTMFHTAVLSSHCTIKAHQFKFFTMAVINILLFYSAANPMSVQPHLPHPFSGDYLKAPHLPPSFSMNHKPDPRIKVRLENENLWNQFDKFCTEMIITKLGR